MKLTRMIQQRMVKAIEGAALVEDVADANGISPTTFYRWMQLGAEPDAPREFREFREAVKKARAVSSVALVGIIRRAAIKNWTAAAWLLERRRPDLWGRPFRQTGNFDLSKLTTDELLTMEALLLKAQPEV